MIVATASRDSERYIRFADGVLYLKVDDKIRKLGSILTRKGALTREQKLKAVAANGEWVRI